MTGIPLASNKVMFDSEGFHSISTFYLFFPYLWTEALKFSHLGFTNDAVGSHKTHLLIPAQMKPFT